MFFSFHDKIKFKNEPLRWLMHQCISLLVFPSPSILTPNCMGRISPWLGWSVFPMVARMHCLFRDLPQANQPIHVLHFQQNMKHRKVFPPFVNFLVSACLWSSKRWTNLPSQHVWVISSSESSWGPMNGGGGTFAPWAVRWDWLTGPVRYHDVPWRVEWTVAPPSFYIRDHLGDGINQGGPSWQPPKQGFEWVLILSRWRV